MLSNTLSAKDLLSQLQVTATTSDIDVKRGPNHEVLIGTKGNKQLQCFVLRGIGINDCTSCETIGNASKITFQNGQMTVECCNTERIKFMYLTAEEVECLQTFDCSNNNLGLT